MKAKMKMIIPIFEVAGVIYFAKKDTMVKCYVCRKGIKAGESYRVSTDSRHFKHVGCELDKVKQ
jgi:hypothetical protein